MDLLTFGLALFVAVHLVSSVAPASCRALKSAIGEPAFRGAYSVLVLAGLVMIVIGWRRSVPVLIYTPPMWGTTAALFLMLIAVVLFGASHARTNLKRYVRHPQLTGVLIWSLAHLLSNGDIRSATV
ncbi:MAG: NnrU family protein, partial [Pseudomonadota bacterium]